MWKKLILVVAVVLLHFYLVSAIFAVEPSFQGIGDLPGGSYGSWAYDVSADGSVVVGCSFSAQGSEAFRWTEETGMVGLGDLQGGKFYSKAEAVNVDGSVVVGRSESGIGGSEAFIWTEESGIIGLGQLDDESYEVAYGVSANGLVVVGYGKSVLGREAFRWTKDSGRLGLGDLDGEPFHSEAWDVSADGSVAVGYSKSALGIEAFRWTEETGMVGLSDLVGEDFTSRAECVSADGLVVVGLYGSSSGTEGFRWSEDSAMIGLGDLNGGGFYSWPFGVSADGAVVVGRSKTNIGFEAFLWDEGKAMRNLKDVLTSDYGLDLSGWTLTAATGISDDGRTIVGWATNPDHDGEAWVATIPEPATPPVADADGPYNIYVGDTLTLDASGSTDADNDIVSYIWDLDDNGSFETDAGGQAIFDVNYTYLQSLGLIVDCLYDIHVQVTDSKEQSDIANSTLAIVPKPAIEVAVDIKPGSCPNPVNTKSSGVLPVAILGSEDLDVTEIVPTSIQLAGVDALRNDYEDVAAPVLDSNDCNCTTEGPDGFLDLTLKFKTQRIVEAIGDVNDGDVLTLELTGVLFGERPIEGADCILIRGKAKSLKGADINKDGVVDSLDFAILAENWLQSSIVQN